MAHIRLIAAALLLLLVFPLHAQNDRLSRKAQNRMESIRIGIITSRLNLKPDEAEKFWPLYNEYRKKLDRILADRMQIIESRYIPEDSISNISDAEAEKILGSILKLNDEYAQTQADYYNRFRKLIGPKRTLDLYLAEVQFKRAIVRELRENPIGKQD